MNLVNAQQARRVLDRLVGYKVSPFLWQTVRYGLSAGRVQSVALRLICEREDEIRAFVPEEYWSVEAELETAARGALHRARLLARRRRASSRTASCAARAASAARAGRRAARARPRRSPRSRSSDRAAQPAPPFITSTLQQDAFNRLGFTSQRTMQVAQQLYEGVRLGREGRSASSPTCAPTRRGWRTRRVGRDARVARQPRSAPSTCRSSRAVYASARARRTRTRRSARPRSSARRTTVRTFLTDEQVKLYDADLGARRGLADEPGARTWPPPSTSTPGALGLRATGTVLGVRRASARLYGRDEDDEASARGCRALAGRAAADGCVEPCGAEQHFTQPPPRYTEATLVKALEERASAGPSTYATIIATITAPRLRRAATAGSWCRPTWAWSSSKLLVEHVPRHLRRRLHRADGGGARRRRERRGRVAPGGARLLGRRSASTSSKAEASKKAAQARASQETTDDPVPDAAAARAARAKFGRNGPFLRLPGLPGVQVHAAGRRRRDCRGAGRDVPAVRDGAAGRRAPAATGASSPARATRRASTRGRSASASPARSGGLGELVERRSKRGKMFFCCNRYPDCEFATWDRPRSAARARRAASRSCREGVEEEGRRTASASSAATRSRTRPLGEAASA